MPHPDALHTLPENDLLHAFEALVDKDRSTTAVVLEYIGEIDHRKLWAKHAYPSMFAFCVERFHMSEPTTAKRIWAARTARRFPVILKMVARGDLHLSGIHLLAKHLTEDNHREVLEKAKQKTVRQIERLIAEIAPRQDVPSRVVTLPRRPHPTPTSPGAQVEVSRRPVAATNGRSRVEPLSPGRYRIEVTVGQQTNDKLRQLQDLLAHQIPNGDPAEIIDRALTALLERTLKSKAAVTDAPRRRSPTRKPQSRSIPASVKREVFERDRGRCTFAHTEGSRCSATRQLEFHHKMPFARGGKHHPDNVELRCRAHNQYEAELDFGQLFMTKKRKKSLISSDRVADT